MGKGGTFLTTPFGVDEIFTREKWSNDQKEFFAAIQDYGREAVAPLAEELEKLDERNKHASHIRNEILNNVIVNLSDSNRT